jgi:two-component sensor histidine kinase
MNASLRLAHKAAKAATWEWRPGRPLRWIDPAAARALVGMPSRWDEDVELTDWRRMVRPEDMAAVNEGVAQLAARGEGRFEFRIAGPGGTDRWLESNGYVAEKGPRGAPARVIGITIDVTERKAVEEVLRNEISVREKAEGHQRLLIHELNHRVKNTLATVQSIAMQSLRGAAGDGEAFDLFTSRLMALGWAHDVLNRENWEGADLDEVIRRMVAVHEPGRFTLEGPSVRLAPNKAVALAMALHELATNAVKYGALSSPEGRVDIRWAVEGEGAALTLSWRERDGPPVAQPTHRGFGSRLIERSLAAELGGRASLVFAPRGVEYDVVARL